MPMSIQGGHTWLGKVRSPICKTGDRPYLVVWSSKLQTAAAELELNSQVGKVLNAAKRIQALITANYTLHAVAILT